MFCVNCGAAVDGDTLVACGSCGKSNAPALTGADISRRIKEASSDAWAATRRVAIDPVAGLASSFTTLGERRAQSAGIAFGVIFALVSAIAAAIGVSKLGVDGNLKAGLGIFIVALVPFATIAALSAGARKLFGGSGSAGADVFTAGVALQPLGVLFLAATFLGSDNLEVIAVLTLFAWTYMLCILFTGSTRLVGLPERIAPPAIATMLLAAGWLTTIAAKSFFGSDTPLGRFFN